MGRAELEMSELNGNEKYHYFSDFVTSYSYTPLGYMEDSAGLAKALGNGNVTVSFRLDGGELPDGKEELRKLYDEEIAT